jgi:hypothetical protein
VPACKAKEEANSQHHQRRTTGQPASSKANGQKRRTIRTNRHRKVWHWPSPTKRREPASLFFSPAKHPPRSRQKPMPLHPWRQTRPQRPRFFQALLQMPGHTVRLLLPADKHPQRHGGCSNQQRQTQE